MVDGLHESVKELTHFKFLETFCILRNIRNSDGVITQILIH